MHHAILLTRHAIRVKPSDNTALFKGHVDGGDSIVVLAAEIIGAPVVCQERIVA